MKKKKIMVVFGTRPEAIKMAPLVLELKKNSISFDTTVIVTGQHKEMLEQVLEIFHIKPDYNLEVMSKNQDLYDLSSKILLGMRDVFKEYTPDIVLVHGDTTTSSIVALAAFYNKIKIGHVEAGLRTYNVYSPWPEEMNRLITSKIANYHFAPTDLSKDNLCKENIVKENIFLTGNTVIDALYMSVNNISTSTYTSNKIKTNLLNAGYDVSRLKSNKRLVLITGHRRENFGEGFTNICKAIKFLHENYPNVDFVYPMHMNPNVREPIHEMFSNLSEKSTNIFFIEPLEYLSFIFLMNESYLILTDSGGIQEEAPSLGKPVLVMRDTTERPEAVSAGTVKLVGTAYKNIIDSTRKLLDDTLYYNSISDKKNPYGDGTASKRIVKILSTLL